MSPQAPHAGGPPEVGPGPDGPGPVQVHDAGDGVFELRLCDAAGKNALSEAVVQGVLAGLERVAAAPAARVCVVRGLPEVFCSGAPLELLAALARGEVAASDIVLSKALLDFPLPTVAAVEGHAVGGGLALALCCDLVFLARESRYGASFMNMGFTPGMGITRLLQLAVGEYVAAEMLLGGRFVKGAALEGTAQVNGVLPRERVVRAAHRAAARMADKPRFALELLKRYLALPRRRAFEETRTVETFMHEVCFARPETGRRIRETYVKER